MSQLRTRKGRAHHLHRKVVAPSKNAFHAGGISVGRVGTGITVVGFLGGAVTFAGLLLLIVVVVVVVIIV